MNVIVTVLPNILFNQDIITVSEKKVIIFHLKNEVH